MPVEYAPYIYYIVDYAVEYSHQAVFFNMGQVCTSGSRTYVQEDIYDEYVKKAVARAKAKTVGNPFDGKFESGPQVKFIFNRSICLLTS